MEKIGGNSRLETTSTKNISFCQVNYMDDATLNDTQLYVGNLRTEYEIRTLRHFSSSQGCHSRRSLDDLTENDIEFAILDVMDKKP
jgi:hypothetical protein